VTGTVGLLLYPGWFALDANALEHFWPGFCGDAGCCPPR
jgi:hypothetical protein